MSAKLLLLPLTAALLLAVSFAVSSCETDVAYGPCDFDTTIQAVCYAPGAGTKLSCLVTDHPTCSERVCLSFQGSTSFCTQTCSGGGDSTCPRGGACLPFIVEGQNHFYCVAPELL